MSSRSVETSARHLGVELVAEGGGLQVLDQDRRDDPGVLGVVRRRSDRRAGDRVEHGAVHGAVRVGVLLTRGEDGHRVAGVPALHVDTEQAANASSRGPFIGIGAPQAVAAGAGRRPGMGTAVAGQRSG